MENKINLKEEILRLSVETGFSFRLLEKDYHLTRILQKISKKRIEDLVFKGGTCLNKCYLGFYRLSEDLDFVLNKDIMNFSKSRVKKILDKLRRTIFEIVNEIGLKTNKKLGAGWKMLTSKKEPRILGLEITARYKSLLDKSLQDIKIEVSFRNKLINLTKIQEIHHEFIDVLGEPFLEKGVKLEVIDLAENFAEKFRALVTRKNIAIRDIFDIYFILEKNLLKIDDKMIKLSLRKIKESLDRDFTKKELIDFIHKLDSELFFMNEKEISSVLRSGEEINMNKMINLIKKSFVDEELIFL